MSKNTITVGPHNWDEEVVHSKLPVLVDFWAPWCAPCRMIAPALDELAGEFAGRVKIAKLNVDEANEISGQFGIRSIPTLLLFKDGKVAEQYVGARPKQEIAQLLATHAPAAAAAPAATPAS
jgi:thioredoxin 1